MHLGSQILPTSYSQPGTLDPEEGQHPRTNLGILKGILTTELCGDVGAAATACCCTYETDQEPSVPGCVQNPQEDLRSSSSCSATEEPYLPPSASVCWRSERSHD